MARLLSYRLFFSAKPTQLNGALIELRHPFFETGVGITIAR